MAQEGETPDDASQQHAAKKRPKTGDSLVEQVQKVEVEVDRLISTVPIPHELQVAKDAITNMKFLINKPGLAELPAKEKKDILLPVMALMPALVAAAADPSDLLTLTQTLDENLNVEKKEVDKALSGTPAKTVVPILKVGGGKKRTKRRVKRRKGTKRRVKKHKKTKRRVKKRRGTKHKRTRHK